MIKIRKCPFSELEDAPNFSDLMAEYAVESSISGLPHPSAKLDAYRLLDKSGMQTTFCSFNDDLLTGFIIVLISPILHYSVEVATVESFFVLKEQRKTGAGTKLRHAAEEYAKLKKSPGLLMSAPIGGDLSQVLPRVGYKETSRVFFKEFAHG